MVITCDSTISKVNILDKIVRVSADICVDGGPVHVIVAENADISTGDKKAAVADTIWKKFLVSYSEQLADEEIAQELNELQDTLNSNIEGRTI